MNDFLKNLTLKYIDTGIGGYGQKYPTDESFIKAWESADYIDDVVEKFDNDAAQRKLDSVTKDLKSLVAGKKKARITRISYRIYRQYRYKIQLSTDCKCESL